MSTMPALTLLSNKIRKKQTNESNSSSTVKYKKEQINEPKKTIFTTKGMDYNFFKYIYIYTRGFML